MSKLGERLEVVGFALKGKTDKVSVIVLMDKIVSALKMNKVHFPVVYDYPVGDAGGIGFTRIQPITESFVAFDSWSDFEGGYLVICSCREVNLNDVSEVVKDMGYKVKKLCANELRLKNEL